MTEFLLSLPFGGDADTDTRVAPFSARVTLSLFQDLLTSPAVGGDYMVRLVPTDAASTGNFAGWSGCDVIDDVVVCCITLNSDRAVTATFR